MPEESLVESLASALSGRLPEDVLAVERVRSVGDRMLGRPGRPVAIEVHDGYLRLRLEQPDDDPPRAWIVREVHDVVISRRQATLGAWLTQLGRTLRTTASASAEARAAADDVLTRLGFPPPVERITVDPEDVAGGLAALPDQLYGRVPADVQEDVRRICAVLLRALERLDDPSEAWTATKIATDYLPTALRAYADLPEDFSDPERVGGGRRPLEHLREQLGMLEREAEKAYQASLEDDAARLVAHGAFLRDRFGEDSALTLAGPPPAPLLADAAVVTARFRDLDADGDGRLDERELQGLMAGLGEPLDAARARALIAAVDADQDGRISEAELLAFLAPGRPS